LGSVSDLSAVWMCDSEIAMLDNSLL